MSNNRRIIHTVAAITVIASGAAYAKHSGADFALPTPALIGVERAPMETSVPPYAITLLERSWDGDPHGKPTGRAVLMDSNGSANWALPNVTDVVSSADGAISVLISADHQLYVSRDGLNPRHIAGSYLSAAISPDGQKLAAHRIGDDGHVIERIQRDDSAIVTIALGSDRVTPYVSGGMVFAPSWLDNDRILFGAGAPDLKMGGLIATVFITDTLTGSVAQVTNNPGDERTGFPESISPLPGDRIVLVEEAKETVVALPSKDVFRPASAFSFVMPRIEGSESDVYVGYVKLRRPNTSWENPVIWQYYDHGGRDWNCGTRTYGGHKGTDIATVFNTNVVAGASGQIIYRYDGCATSNSYGCGAGWGNAAALRHADGTASLEAHGVQWSVVVSNGQWLSCAQTLFRAGSSGSSSVHHVHHESWENSGGASNPALRFDPFKGGCNAIPASKWAVQNGYMGNPGTGCTN